MISLLSASSQLNPSISRVPTTMSSALSFLDLPHNIRLNIYGYSGLIRSCPIELNVPDGYDPQHHEQWNVVSWTECLYEKRKRGSDKHRVLGRNYPDCICPKLPTQLLRVSHGFYDDAFPVLYSKNKFVLRAQSADDLGLLLALNKHVLSTMNSLLVRLNHWPCVRGHEEIIRSLSTCFSCSTPSTNPDYALDLVSAAGQYLVTLWTTTAFHLAAAITPEQLKLTFICDVVDLDSGKAILLPLLRLPALKQCTIRLSRQPNYELSTLARQVSSQATRSFVRNSEPFPFKRLPPELRVHILSYTELGRHGNYYESDDRLHIRQNKLVHGFLFPSMRCCRQCTETLIDCCCPPARAAHTEVCTCRRIPFELFFVDKEMYQDAMAAFLQQNCFDFLQDPEKTIDFLSRFPKESLKHIREIQFRFSGKEARMWTQQDYSRKWLALITFVKTYFKVPQLRIVVVAETFDLGMSSEDDDQTRPIYEVYCDITRSLCTLGGVGNIRFNLGWFTQLGPLMSRAVAGVGHEGQYPELVVPPRDRNRPHVKIPPWFRESDLTEDA